MVEPLPLKPDGTAYVQTDWTLEPPYCDCEARFRRSIEVFGQPQTPRGQAWCYGIYVWACYMRYTKDGQLKHRHHHWIDPEKVRALVTDGHANDPFLGLRYSLKCDESPSVPANA